MPSTHGTARGDAGHLHSTESAYELEVNGLEELVAFAHTPAGLCVVSQVAAPAGSHFAYITSHAPQPQASWKTIQTSAATHTDPRSALLYMNHSCAPSLEVHTYAPDAHGRYPAQPPRGRPRHPRDAALLTPAGLAGEVRVARDRDLRPGDALTFFYPSTEWHMDRPFRCLCGAGHGVCLETVAGADAIDPETLERWFVNDHIWRLVKQRA